MFKLFSKNKPLAQQKTTNWYDDRIGIITSQRNFLLFGLGVFSILLLILLFTLFIANKSRTIEPFVIEISKKSGIATIVDPVKVIEYSANRAVNSHFIVEYVKARELFNPATYQYYYYTYARLFSSTDIYNNFLYSLRLSNQSSPINLYSNVVNSKLIVRSIQYLEPKTAQLRFTVELTERDSKMIKRNKVATIGFEYASLNINQEDRYINPLGFIVNSYQIDDDYA